MAQADKFALDLSAWCKAAGDKADLLIRKVSLDLFTRVIMRSPVDTGRFRGNWQVGIGTVPTGTVDVVDKEGDTTVAKVAGTMASLKEYGHATTDVIYLANNLPYARALEYGHSQKQAPRGMVRVSIQEFRAIVNKAVKQSEST